MDLLQPRYLRKLLGEARDMKRRAPKVRRIVLGTGWRHVQVSAAGWHCDMTRGDAHTRYCIALFGPLPMIDSARYRRCRLVLEVLPRRKP